VKDREFLDKMNYIYTMHLGGYTLFLVVVECHVPRNRWCDIVLLSAHAPAEDKDGNTKYSSHEGIVLYLFHLLFAT
jgi:hypothetical protein